MSIVEGKGPAGPSRQQQGFMWDLAIHFRHRQQRFRQDSRGLVKQFGHLKMVNR